MKNGIKMNVFNSQDVIVFNNYQLYKNDAAFEKDEGNILPKELFIENSSFDIQKFFSTQLHFLKDDLKNLLDYEDLTETELNNRIFAKNRTARFEDEKYKTIITRLNINHDETDLKTYKLKDINGLYTELAKIEPFNIVDILKFSNVFGLPTGLLETVNQDYSGEYPITVQSVNYMELNSQLMTFRSVFKDFKNIITGDLDGIKQRKLELHDNSNALIPELSALFDNDQTFYSEEKGEIILENEKSDFIERINVHDFFKGRLDYKNNTYIMENYFRNLFDYGYFQMSQALINNSELKECKNCHHLFEVSADNPEFCPPLPFSDESQCKIELENK